MHIEIAKNLSNLAITMYADNEKTAGLAESLKSVLNPEKTRMFSSKGFFPLTTAKRLKEYLNMPLGIIKCDCLWALGVGYVDRTKMNGVDRLLREKTLGRDTSSLILVAGKSVAHAYAARLFKYKYSLTPKVKEIEEGQAYFFDIKTGAFKIIP